MINNTQYSTGGKVNVPLDAPSSFAASAGNAKVTLTWTDPPDKTSQPSGQTIATWSYTRIVRKTGSQPTGPHDGELVVSSSVRDQYVTNGFVDDGLTNDTLYYYAAFAYNTDSVASEGAFGSATPQAGTPIVDLAEGTIITINENGTPVEFYVTKHNYEPALNTTSRTLIVRNAIYDQRAWGQNPMHQDFSYSQIFSWLNGSYKNLFSDKVQQKMGETFYPSTISYTTVGTLSSAVFFLFKTEMGGSGSDFNVEGSKVPIFAQLYKAPGGGRDGDLWWTRTIYNKGPGQVWVVSGMGEGDISNGRYSRPCFTLPSDARVDSNNALIET